MRLIALALSLAAPPPEPPVEPPGDSSTTPPSEAASRAPRPDDEFGWRISKGPDQDGDGIPEVWVGDPARYEPGVSGEVFQLSGSDGRSLRRIVRGGSPGFGHDIHAEGVTRGGALLVLDRGDESDRVVVLPLDGSAGPEEAVALLVPEGARLVLGGMYASGPDEVLLVTAEHEPEDSYQSELRCVSPATGRVAWSVPLGLRAMSTYGNVRECSVEPLGDGSHIVALHSRWGTPDELVIVDPRGKLVARHPFEEEVRVHGMAVRRTDAGASIALSVQGVEDEARIEVLHLRTPEEPEGAPVFEPVWSKQVDTFEEDPTATIEWLDATRILWIGCRNRPFESDVVEVLLASSGEVMSRRVLPGPGDHAGQPLVLQAPRGPGDATWIAVSGNRWNASLEGVGWTGSDESFRRDRPEELPSTLDLEGVRTVNLDG